jgi:hypothetical protein
MSRLNACVVLRHRRRQLLGIVRVLRLPEALQHAAHSARTELSWPERPTMSPAHGACPSNTAKIPTIPVLMYRRSAARCTEIPQKSS